MKKLLKILFWIGVSVAGAGALGAIAFERGEPLNATWFIVAACGTYLVAYRFYSAFVASRVLALDSSRATPAERLDDGRDFVPTNKWVVMGHHFAAIAGPGPLLGPTLAAQFGYLPGTIWLIAGAVLGGCVQDFVILFCSIRRDGKSLGQMAREEVSRRGGMIALLAVLAIMIILLAVVGLVIVNALKTSPWATFTLAMTVPIAMLMGLYMRYWRPGRVLEASATGFALILFVVVAGQWVAESPSWARVFTLSGPALAIAIILYGYAASALPVWLLLAPRDYLSAFIKVGAVWALAAGILLVRPTIQMSPLTRFADGTGPVFAGTIFPFCFITIACGAVSGFHSLIASGTTPKLITREGHARLIGYGSMLMESFVGVMAMVAACALSPGVYFAMNSPAGIVGQTAEAAAVTISSWGFPLEPQTMHHLAQQVGERTLLNRTGGAPSLAVGMAQVFSRTLGGTRLLGIWYHFALMFEALFILTVLDAGTRVGRFMVQELLAHAWKPFGRTSWYPSTLLTSALIVGAPSLAVGMAQVFSHTLGGTRLLGIWYHFALMFEALFILTVLDAGTRVGRFMVQELLAHVWKPFGRTSWYPSTLLTSALIVGAWGYFLYLGVLDPLGGINSLWPMFGIANQLLAAVALVVATTILIKMGRLRWIWVTLGPMIWVLSVTMTGSFQKIFHPNPSIGFLAYANQLAAKLAAGGLPAAKAAETARLVFNQRLNAVVVGVLAAMALILVFEALYEWFRILSKRAPVVLHEAPYVATRWAEGD